MRRKNLGKSLRVTFPVWAVVSVLGLSSCNSGGTPTDSEPETGSIRVTSNTAGLDLDSDGYTVSMDGGSFQTLNTIGSVTFSNVPTGSHSMEVSGLAQNCTVDGSNPTAVSVSVGTIANANFDITCVSLTKGTLEVRFSTGGADLDPDGYQVSLDGTIVRSVGVNGVATYNAVEQGQHEIEVSDVAGNCSLTGDNPAAVTVVAGESRQLAYQITCQALARGNLQITASTENNLDPDGFDVLLDGDSLTTVPVNGSITLDGVLAGDWQLELVDVAPNCVLGGKNPRTVTVSEGETTSASYSITCSDPPGGRILFFEDFDDGRWISAINPDGSGRIKYVNVGPSSYFPSISFSPDGDRVAFSTFGDLYLMNKDASGMVMLSPIDLGGTDPDWSFDGTRIAFGAQYEIYTIGADGTGLSRVSDNPQGYGSDFDGFPSWSPDGSKIVFTRHVCHRVSDTSCWPTYSTVLVNADGTGEVELSPPSACANDPLEATWADSNPKWSQDGAKILFHRNPGNCSNDPEGLWIMNPDGSDPVFLASIGESESFDWAPPNRSRIAYMKPDGLFVMNADGTDLTFVVDWGGGAWASFSWGG